MRALPVVALLLTVLALACSGDSDADRVESVLRTYIDHYIDSEPEEMYALLDSGSQELCPQERFVAFVSAAREALGESEFEIVEIRDLVVEGDTASATVLASVDDAEAEPTENTLVKEDGNWRLELPSIGC